MALTCALVSVAPKCLAAQSASVIGVVVAENGRTPLAGVYVALVDEEIGREATAILTDTRGRFAMPGSVNGRYRVRAQRVGLANAETPDFILTAEGRDLILVMLEQPVELRGLRVESPVRSCDLDQDAALLVQKWWEESRKALKNADYVHSQRGRGYRFERFRREWSADLQTLRAEETSPPDSTTRLPFRAPDAAVLAEQGFVQGNVGSRQFFAPDPAVLLSEAFLDGHCFRPESSDDPGVLRLRVDPVQESARVDIAGVLSVDTISGRLASFEFRYEGLPDDLRIASEAGGRLEFDYLPSGDWIVSEWWIRMPWIDPRVWPRRVLAYLDEGGRIVEVPSHPEGRIAIPDPSPAVSGQTGAPGPPTQEISPVFTLEPIEVSVRNERIIDMLNLSLGTDPRSMFGFRLIQGDQLDSAKRNGSLNPTEVLRWLFIPVIHGGPCVYVNVERSGAGRATEPNAEPFCGNLFVDEEWVPNEQLDSVDIADVVVVTALPGEVRMFTRAFLEGR